MQQVSSDNALALATTCLKSRCHTAYGEASAPEWKRRRRDIESRFDNLRLNPTALNRTLPLRQEGKSFM